MTKITISHLSFAYRKKDLIIKDLNLEIPAGLSLLTGPTGCGKSTLLKLIAGLYPKYAGHRDGQIVLNGLTKAMMFQNPAEQFTMATPREEIIFALENLGLNKDEYERKLDFAVKFSQIDKFLDQKIITLSGGEKQRVALAVLVAMDVDLLLLDEPFASVDPEARKFLIEKLNELKNLGKTIIISDHVFDDYQNICDHVFSFKNQTVYELSFEETRKLFDIKASDKKSIFALPTLNNAKVFSLKNTEIRQNRLLLKQDDLKIYKGKITLITGPNGVGKSSFFKALTKMIPYEGSMTFENQEIAKLKARKYLLHVAQIFQCTDDQFLAVTVQDEINLSKKDRNPYFTDERIKEALKLLDLDTHLDQVVYSLSGGQKKKLQILLMLITKHEVLLIDEPLSGLDKNSIKQVVQLMREAQKSLQQTFLIISHQIDELADLCDYRLNLDDQQLNYISEAPYESKS
ncbi:ABC transporter ATP-binding protein [Lactobacillus hamsteri]|uniref:ABC superfamily ATP binding cassette transporter, ABC protein n=1 Tax=Lactobacillus hamsteri DSM 5661 = JCM 6256 TaxID=1423754 RepID=A0A0R1YE80_9LACO|nr:ABC transporter ATP-binding protein [Lactobacillus hamsteri]KRM40653.1 ABC superfamily ATP binding cassette transporter, ABC protein [Lactobacillus hamsteri DSM 5661 = JCM 6256]